MSKGSVSKEAGFFLLLGFIAIKITSMHRKRAHKGSYPPGKGLGACHHPKNVERVCLERGRLFHFVKELTEKLSASSLHFLSRHMPTSNFPATTRKRDNFPSL